MTSPPPASATARGAKRLMLLRHAKSDRPPDVSDHDRPLAERGRVDAPRMGAYMAREGLVPDLVLVSTARRTQETWSLLHAALPAGIAARDTPDLYDAGTRQILSILQHLERAACHVLVIGHNPGLQRIALLLAAGDGEEHLTPLREKLPTTGLAVIDFADIAWAELAEESGRLERFVSPHSLP